MSDATEESRLASSSSTGAAGGPGSSPLRLLSARGDPTDPSVFSGTPHYFLKAAVKGGIIDGPVPLPRDGLGFAVRRIVWNATRPLTGDRHGGYQYTTARRNRQWAAARPMLAGACILNAWQLLPRFVVEDDSIKRWYFIDQTLTQLYEEYGEQDIIGRRIARNALREEREGYEAAQGIIAHSRWAAASLIGGYQIPASKVYVVTQAANIDESAYATWEADELHRREQEPAEGRRRPLRFVFVGLDGRRKGLDRFLRGLSIARSRGSTATLRVIGAPAKQMPADLRTLPGVEWCGRINKQRDPQRFLRLVGECDVGCLLSRIEAGGCGLSEYQALGLAVMGTSAGGAAEQVLPGNGVIVDVTATAEEIADTILQLEREPELVDKMRQVAWQQRRAATWSRRVEEIRMFWPCCSKPTS